MLMISRISPRGRRKWLTAAVYAVAICSVCYCIFWLPFVVPTAVGPRIRSTSYAVGFSNRTAIAVVVLLLGLLTARALWRRSTPAVQWAPCTPVPISRMVFVSMAIGYLLATTAVYIVADSVDWYGLDWESSHFLWRMKLTETYGLQPYTGYQFEYGPALAYMPLAVHSLLRQFGAANEFSYYLSHYLLNLAGLGSIAFVLARAGMPARMRDLAFIALATAAFLPNMGLNGVVLRYTAPLFSITMLDRPGGPMWLPFSGSACVCHFHCRLGTLHWNVSGDRHRFRDPAGRL